MLALVRLLFVHICIAYKEALDVLVLKRTRSAFITGVWRVCPPIKIWEFLRSFLVQCRGKITCYLVIYTCIRDMHVTFVKDLELTRKMLYDVCFAGNLGHGMQGCRVACTSELASIIIIISYNCIVGCH